MKHPADDAPHDGLGDPDDPKTLSEWLHTVFEGSCDAIFISDAQAHFVAVNRAACDLTGFGRDELLRLTIPDLHGESDLHAYQAFHSRIMAGEELITEAKILRKDNTKVDVEFNNRRIMIGGRPMMHTVARDITPRRKAEEEHRRTSEALEAVLAAAPVAVLLLDLEGRVDRVWNRAAESMFGWARDEVLGQRLPIVPPEAEGEFGGLLERIRAGEAIAGLELTRRHRNGSPVQTTLFTAPVHDVGGNVVGIASVLADSSARRRAEARAAFLNRLLLMTNAITKAVVREGNRHRILERAAEIAVEVGGFPAAGIALVDPHRREVAMEAVAGLHFRGRRVYRLALDDPAPGPVLRAIRERRAVVTDTLPERDPWRPLVAHEGLGAAAAIPMNSGGEVLGVLVLASHQKEQLEGELLELLQGSADDIAFALRSIDAEERYRNLFERSPLGIYRTTPEGRILSANPSLVHMLSFDSVEDLQGCDFPQESLHAGQSRAAFLEVLERDGFVRGFESTWRRRDGSEIHVRESARALRGANGRVAYIEGTVEDVTTQRAMLEELRLAKVVVENAHTTLVRWRPGEGWPIDYVTENIDQFGIHAADLLSGAVHYHDVVHPDDVARIKEESASLLARGVDRFVQRYRLVAPDGQIFHVEDRTIVMRDELGAVSALYGVLIDVTATTLAEQALAASESTYRQLFEQANDAILVFDPEDGTVLEANPRACEVYGVPRDELVGRSVPSLSAEPEATRSRMKALRTSHRQLTFEAPHLHASGRELRLLISASVIELGNRPAVLSIHHDVTEQRAMEERLRQGQKLEAVGRLAGGVAHDFNNLLQSMLAHVARVEHTVSNPGRQQDALADLSREIRRGAAVTRQLLLFAREETERPERLDLAEVVDSDTALLARLLPANVTLRLELSARNLDVVADRGQLAQVVMNLVLNAADAMPSGGSVVIRAGHGDEGFVRLEVADTGVGIDPKNVSHLFEPFFTTKAPGMGSGLGLSVVHGIVTRHGGEVLVESRPGQGTTFTVFLPAAEAGGGEASRTPPAAGAGDGPRSDAGLAEERGRRILVVEDEDGARQGLCEVLAHLGFEVTSAGTGREVQALPDDEPFDLVLTDVMLPDANGADLAEELRERWPGLEVILMSGYTRDVAVRQSIRCGEVRFLQKPFDMDALTAEVGPARRRRSD